MADTVRQPLEIADNPVLQGNFAPVDTEVTSFDLPVTGTIPEHLDGMLLRDGPNPVNPGPGHHWFIGDAMLHGISLAGGRATAYRNRWVRTKAIQAAKGWPAAPLSPNQPMVQGSGNVNVIGHGGRILALPEVGLPWEMGADLATVGQHDFAGRLKTNMTAHPKIDGKTGELLFFGYDFGPVFLRYHVAAPDGTPKRTIDIAKPYCTMMHDFAVTATRVVFMDFPVVFDLQMAMAGRRLPFAWREDLPARLGILSRDAGTDTTQWIETEPCYVYHLLNAFDDGRKIVIDVVRHPKTFVAGDLEGSGGASRLERWTVDPDAGRVDRQVVDDRGQEFPRVDPRVECHPHRYGYCVEFLFGRNPGNLVKHDMRTGTRQIHDVGAGGAASEGVFVPRGPGEDNGWLLSVVHEAESDSSHLRIIDAADFTAPPVAKVHLPQRVPFGFHGNWVPGVA